MELNFLDRHKIMKHACIESVSRWFTLFNNFLKSNARETQEKKSIPSAESYSRNFNEHETFQKTRGMSLMQCESTHYSFA